MDSAETTKTEAKRRVAQEPEEKSGNQAMGTGGQKGMYFEGPCLQAAGLTGRGKRGEILNDISRDPVGVSEKADVAGEEAKKVRRAGTTQSTRDGKTVARGGIEPNENRGYNGEGTPSDEATKKEGAESSEEGTTRREDTIPDTQNGEVAMGGETKSNRIEDSNDERMPSDEEVRKERVGSSTGDGKLHARGGEEGPVKQDEAVERAETIPGTRKGEVAAGGETKPSRNENPNDEGTPSDEAAREEKVGSFRIGTENDGGRYPIKRIVPSDETVLGARRRGGGRYPIGSKSLERGATARSDEGSHSIEKTGPSDGTALKTKTEAAERVGGTSGTQSREVAKGGEIKPDENEDPDRALDSEATEKREEKSLSGDLRERRSDDENAVEESEEATNGDREIEERRKGCGKEMEKPPYDPARKPRGRPSKIRKQEVDGKTRHSEATTEARTKSEPTTDDARRTEDKKRKRRDIHEETDTEEGRRASERPSKSGTEGDSGGDIKEADTMEISDRKDRSESTKEASEKTSEMETDQASTDDCLFHNLDALTEKWRITERRYILETDESSGGTTGVARNFFTCGPKLKIRGELFMWHNWSNDRKQMRAKLTIDDKDSALENGSMKMEGKKIAMHFLERHSTWGKARFIGEIGMEMKMKKGRFGGRGTVETTIEIPDPENDYKSRDHIEGDRSDRTIYYQIYRIMKQAMAEMGFSGATQPQEVPEVREMMNQYAGESERTNQIVIGNRRYEITIKSDWEDAKRHKRQRMEAPEEYEGKEADDNEDGGGEDRGDRTRDHGNAF